MGTTMGENSNTSGLRQGECSTLIEACTPLIYVRNPFRITGLAVDASTRDIKRRIDDLKQAEESGEAEEEHQHAFALTPPPTIEVIREAALSLQDPERRIIEEFFWFWPNKWGSGNSDPALIALKDGNKTSAFKTWVSAMSDGQGIDATVAKHNLAVMYHLVALDSEHVALEHELEPEQHLTIEEYWQKCFLWWEELAEDEVFWSLVTDRIRMIDDPRLTTGHARRMRITFPEAMDKINALLAINYAERGKFDHVSNHIRYMKATNQGQDNVPKTLKAVTKSLRERVQNAVEKARASADRAPSQAAKSVHELLQAVAEPMRTLQMILPADDHEWIDLSDGVADGCFACQIAYARETKDWTTSHQILKSAANYAVSSETKERIADNLKKVADNQVYALYLEPLTKIIEGIDETSSFQEKVLAVNNVLMPRLLAVEQAKGITKETYGVCADSVARYIRGLSVVAYNENSDLAWSIRILDVAIATARGKELCELLRKDRAQLDGFQADSAKHNLFMKIRSDEIEVTREVVRYNEQKVLVSQIKGVKFGVFVQYTNGVESSSSYLIEIDGREAGSIRIECKRIFRSSFLAEQDFNRVLEALFHQVVPSLVRRLAEEIVSGHPLQMGVCRVTADGVYITSGGLWRQKETLVPWSDLRFGSHQGRLTLRSEKDANVTTEMALREAWNAVFFKSIADTVVELKSKRKG